MMYTFRFSLILLFLFQIGKAGAQSPSNRLDVVQIEKYLQKSYQEYMERRGSGLRKIVSETEKLPGYTEAYKPEFSSTATDFRVILKNVNYHHDYSIMDINQVKTQVKTQVTTFDEILVFCSIPHSKAEIADYCGYKNNKNFTKKYLRPLLDSGTLKMTIPNKPNSRNQKYITVRTE